jgi:hypothetical protein
MPGSVQDDYIENNIKVTEITLLIDGKCVILRTFKTENTFAKLYSFNILFLPCLCTVKYRIQTKICTLKLRLCISSKHIDTHGVNIQKTTYELCLSQTDTIFKAAFKILVKYFRRLVVVDALTCMQRHKYTHAFG